MQIREALAAVQSGRSLTRSEARGVFLRVLEPLNAERESRLAALLSALALRGETAAEIAGAADALRTVGVRFEHDHGCAIDTCGTGGDGSGSFNISTAAALVVAGAGAPVVKHGNRAVSSRSGSADLLEACGAVVDLSPDAARAALDETGFTFLFAPRYHPALRHAAGVRRALGMRTVFNLVGPLVNPGRVRRQLLGVADAALLDVFANVLRELDLERAAVVHGAGGLDELALAHGNRAVPVGELSAVPTEPGELGLSHAPVEALAGGDPAHNRVLLEQVLDGQHGPLRDAVLLNASAALVVAGRATSAEEAIDRAAVSIDSGAAADVLARYAALTRRLSEEDAA